MKLDIEVSLNNIKATLLQKLNAKLLEIDAEKNDGIVLKPVAEGAYILQSMDEFPVNYDPALFYGIDSAAAQAEYGAIAKNVRVEVTVILADSQDKKLFSRLFRYQRALEEIFTENYASIVGMREKIKISSLEPVSFKTANATKEFKAIGVLLEFNLFS